MIPKSAVKKFFARDRRDFRTYKRLSDRQLEDRADRLPKSPPIWTRLRWHQKAAFLAAVKAKRLGLWLDTGMGKTLLAMSIARYFRKAEIGRQFLVLVPSRINKDEWEREIKKHSRHTSYCILRGSSEDKWEQLSETDATLVIETYGGLLHMVCDRVGKRGKQKLKPNKRLVKMLREIFDGLILDESHKCKAHDRLPFRICRAMSKTMPVVLCMSGTPFGRDPSDLWAQMFLIDRGHTLGETLGLFRAAMFIEESNGFQIKYRFDPKQKAELNNMLAHASLRFEAKESDLPFANRIPKKVQLPDEAAAYYDLARKAVIAAGGSYRETKNAFLRMRQISSGFLGYHDDELGEKASYEFAENPKLESLMAVIDAVHERDKIVVCHDFIFSGRKIADALAEAGIGFVAINGLTKDTKQPLHQFDADDRKRVLVLSNNMAIGLNLQTAKYVGFYESPVPVITRTQAERRIHRQESKHEHVFIFDFIVEDTVDETILHFHRSGRNLFKAIIDGKVKL